MGNFDHKDHACNKLNADKSLDPNSERAQLNKYTHFLNRYNIHQQSINLEEKLLALADKVMQELLDKVIFFFFCESRQIFVTIMKDDPLLIFEGNDLG